ncbi:hypothetical protein OAP56_04415 [Rickettsiaceae bacterium]|nr:hypothetical protein [Rickettsiaceae bacterium]
MVAECLNDITKLDIIIQAHVLPDNDSGLFTLGTGFDLEGFMGNPKFIPSEILTQQLSQISKLVLKTDVVSIACYGQKMINDQSIKDFHPSTRFCFLSNEDSTWQGDLSTNSNILQPFFKQFQSITIMETVLYSYASNLGEKSFIPSILDKDGKELMNLKDCAQHKDFSSNAFFAFLKRCYANERGESLDNKIKELPSDLQSIDQVIDKEALGILIGCNTYDKFFDYECDLQGLEAIFPQDEDFS